jgi:hypothetical protein
MLHRSLPLDWGEAQRLRLISGRRMLVAPARLHKPHNFLGGPVFRAT